MSKKKVNKWTIVQHSAFGYNQDPTFAKGVEERSVTTEAEEKRVIAAGGVLFDSYEEASEFGDQVNGVKQTGPASEESVFGPNFLNAKGTFSDKEIDGLRIYIPVRTVEAI